MDINRSRPPKDGDIALWLSGVINDAIRDAIEAGLRPEDAFFIAFDHARSRLPGWDRRLGARTAARLGLPLDGADAQALEAALACVEKERVRLWDTLETIAIDGCGCHDGQQTCQDVHPTDPYQWCWACQASAAIARPCAGGLR